MPSKTKKTIKFSERAAELAGSVGMILMTAAALTGVFEFQDRSHSRVVIPSRPVFAYAPSSELPVNALRREREEIGIHYISYSETQRTPSRTGKR